MASGVCVRCCGGFLVMGDCDCGSFVGNTFQQKGMNGFDHESSSFVYAIHGRHTACLSCGLVQSEVLPEELRELVERNGSQTGTASGVCACVRCAGHDLVDCICGGSGRPIGYGFRPDDLHWSVLPSPSPRPPIARPIYQYHVACLSCGLVWFEVRPRELRDLIERKGSEELKQQLPPVNRGVFARELATANPLRLLNRVQRQASERKLRLLVCACARIVLDSSFVRHCQSAVDVAERFADGLATPDELREVRDTTDSIWTDAITAVDDRDVLEGAQIIISQCWSSDYETFWVWEFQKRRETGMRYNRLVADVFFPLLSGPVAFGAGWRTSTAVALAQQMYDSRDFSIMPILADALQDAGCDNDDILSHCRDPEQPHVRGCWVVDLLLGKE